MIVRVWDRMVKLGKSFLFGQKGRKVAADICEGFHIGQRFHSLEAELYHIGVLFPAADIEKPLFFWYHYFCGRRFFLFLYFYAGKDGIGAGGKGLGVRLDIEYMIRDEGNRNLVD